jgi:hypothetical protein
VCGRPTTRPRAHTLCVTVPHRVHTPPHTHAHTAASPSVRTSSRVGADPRPATPVGHGHERRPPLPFPCHRREGDVVVPPVTDLGAHAALTARSPELGVESSSAAAASTAGASFATATSGHTLPHHALPHHALPHGHSPPPYRAPNRTAAAPFPWAFFTHRKLLFAWRGSASRTAWAAAAPGTRAGGAANASRAGGGGGASDAGTSAANAPRRTRDGSASAGSSSHGAPLTADEPTHQHRPATDGRIVDVRQALLHAFGRTASNGTAGRNELSFPYKLPSHSGPRLCVIGEQARQDGTGWTTIIPPTGGTCPPIRWRCS